MKKNCRFAFPNDNPEVLLSPSSASRLHLLVINGMPGKQRTTSVKEKKLNDRIAKLAQDAQRNDGTSIRDTDLQQWVAPPVSWSYHNLMAIAVTRFKDFIKLIGPDDPRGKLYYYIYLVVMFQSTLSNPPTFFSLLDFTNIWLRFQFRSKRPSDTSPSVPSTCHSS